MTLRWNWGMALALVYTTFAAGTATMVTIAVRQRTDLVTPDYYAQSLRHDQRAAAVANAVSLGRDLAISYSAEAGALLVQLPAAMSAARGTVTLYRPSDASLDRTLLIATDTHGVQKIDVRDLAAGTWRVQVAWTAEERPFFLERAIAIQ